MTTLQQIQSETAMEFEKRFVEYNSSGERQIVQFKPWYNGHTDEWEHPDVVDEIKILLLSAQEKSYRAAVESIRKIAVEMRDVFDVDETGDIKEDAIRMRERTAYQTALSNLIAELTKALTDIK